MAERVVKVRLTAAVEGYKQAMKEAADATKRTGDEAQAAGDKVAAYRSAFNAVGAAGIAMGAVLGAGFGVAVKKFADFDAAMSSVQAAVHESAGNMDLLRHAALDAGESTVFSATESAAAIEELAKAGISTADILNGGLTGALDLAAAGNIGVAEAAGIAATSLKMFALEGDDMSHVADLLAAGAGKAMGDVDDLAQALNQAGLVANQTGLSIEETTAGLAAFAEQGLLGSDAGTSFKTMLQAMSPSSAAAAAAIEKYGLSAYDAQGNFIGLAEYAGKLKTGLAGLSTEQQNATLKTVFGADAVRAASVLYQNGAEGIEEWTAAVDDQGYAAQTAALRLDNLKGDVEALGGALETALIDSGSAANDTLRTMAQALTGLLGMYNDLPTGVQATVTAVGGATAAVALSGGAAFLAVPKYLEFKAAVEGAGWSMKGVTLTAGAAGLALGGLFAIVGELASEYQEAQARQEAYASSLEKGTHRITEATRELIATRITDKDDFLNLSGYASMADSADKLGISLSVVRKAIEGDADALTELNAKTQEAIDGYNFWDNASISAHSSAQLLRQEVEKETGALGRAAELAREKAEATRESGDVAESAADAYSAEADAIQDLSSQLTSLIDKINAANGVAQDAEAANARYQSALAGLSAEVEKNGASLDANTAAGSANRAALADLAGAAQNAAQAQFEQDLATMSADEAAKNWNSTLAAQRQAFVDSAVAAGYNATEVQALADRIFQMPDKKTVDMLVETAYAQNAIDQFITLNNGRRVKVHVDVDVNQSFNVGGKTVSGMSTGGPVTGRGPKGRDSELRMLAPGEHVIPADEVDAAGGHDNVAMWRAMLKSGASEPMYSAPRPEPVYVSARGAGGWGYGEPAPAQPISLDGLTIRGTLEIGGDGLARIVNGQIVAHDESANAWSRSGARS